MQFPVDEQPHPKSLTSLLAVPLGCISRYPGSTDGGPRACRNTPVGHDRFWVLSLAGCSDECHAPPGWCLMSAGAPGTEGGGAQGSFTCDSRFCSLVHTSDFSRPLLFMG